MSSDFPLGNQLQASLASRYVIERELGRGASSIVFLGQDAKHRRAVAIKVLLPELSSTLSADRFLREIEIAAGLHHPHILPIYDSGEAGGLFYFVMPCSHGESIRDRVSREKQLPIDEALRYAGEVADALSYAHARGVVHRDIKPENILLESSHAVVTDFGIAQAVTSHLQERLTGPGIAVGTPAYMSPEQAAADPAIDERTDLYSLGCVLYEMLVGEPPFTGATAESIILQRFTQRAPRASAKRAGIPRAVDDVIQRAMARAPADRFASASQLAEAIGAAGRQSRPAGGSVTSPPPGRSVAVLPFENMSADPENEFFVDGMAEEIINALTQVEGLRVAARASAFTFKGKHEDLRVIGEKLNVATVLQGSIRRSGNRLRITAQLVDVDDGYHLWSERYDRELTDVFAIQDDIATAIVRRLRITMRSGQDDLVRPPTENLEAYEQYLKGRSLIFHRGRYVGVALECYDRAVHLDPDFALAYAGLADCLALVGFYGGRRPRELMIRATECATRAVALAPNSAEAHHALARCRLFFEFDREVGVRELDRAFALGPRNVQVLSSHAIFATELIRGDNEGAIATAQRAVEIDPLNAFPIAVLAHMLLQSGRFAEARRMARRAIQVDPHQVFALQALMVACGSDGAYDEAKAVGAEALALTGRDAWSLAALSGVCFACGDPRSAESIHLELLARRQREYIPSASLGVTASNAGLMDDAFEFSNRAIEECEPQVLTLLSPGWPPARAIRSDPRFAALRARAGWIGDLS